MSSLDNLTPEAIQVLSSDIVPVCYLVELDYGDSRFMSTNQSLSALGEAWVEAAVKVASSSNWETAQIALDNSTGRYTTTSLDSEWRGAVCNIWLAIFKPDAHTTGRYVKKGYVKSGYTKTEYTEPSKVVTTIKLFSGTVSSANNIDQQVVFNLSRPEMTSKFSPRIRMQSPTFNHIPVEGTVIKWNGDTLELTRGN